MCQSSKLGSTSGRDFFGRDCPWPCPSRWLDACARPTLRILRLMIKYKKSDWSDYHKDNGCADVTSGAKRADDAHHHNDVGLGIFAAIDFWQSGKRWNGRSYAKWRLPRAACDFLSLHLLCHEPHAPHIGTKQCETYNAKRKMWNVAQKYSSVHSW